MTVEAREYMPLRLAAQVSEVARVARLWNRIAQAVNAQGNIPEYALGNCVSRR
jgi:hypothetical protein